MGRKVFISFLGTNNYVETIYSFGPEKKSKPVRFIQEALIEENCKGWNEKDRIYIFCTEKAESCNWKDNGHPAGVVKEEIEKIGLEHRLNALQLNVPIEMVSIDEGFSESEIWGIFDAVYEKLENDDNIYFDVTHAFRSIPLFSTILFNYSRLMKRTKVISIQYGAFEKLGPAFEVRKMDLEQRVAPILDLKNILNLQIYNQVADNLINYGRVRGVIDALDVDDKIANVFKQLTKSINNFDGYILTNRSSLIEDGKVFTSFMNAIKPVQKGAPAPMQKILELLKENLSAFKPEKSLDNVKAAIDWALKYDMMPQAYTLGQEYIITLCVNRLKNKNPYEKTKNGEKFFRSYVSSLLNISDEDVEDGKFKKELSDYPELAKELLTIDWIKRLRVPFRILSNWRNYINHAKSTKSPEEFKPKFQTSFTQCLGTFHDSNQDANQHEQRLFINLSNHPCETWSKPQIEAALMDSVKILDFPFPTVEPDWDEEGISKLAKEISSEIIKHHGGEISAIHVMGEFTLTSALVHCFQKEGYTCVASTSKRIVEMLPDGSKNVKFEFCRFRRYE